MENKDRLSETRAGRRRLEEIREKRRESVGESIARSRFNVTTNLIIEVLSGVLFGVGLFYALRFLSLQRQTMGETAWRTFYAAFVIIGVGWFAWLFWKIRGNVKRLFELRKM